MISNKHTAVQQADWVTNLRESLSTEWAGPQAGHSGDQTSLLMLED